MGKRPVLWLSHGQAPGREEIHFSHTHTHYRFTSKQGVAFKESEPQCKTTVGLENKRQAIHTLHPKDKIIQIQLATAVISVHH